MSPTRIPAHLALLALLVGAACNGASGNDSVDPAQTSTPEPDIDVTRTLETQRQTPVGPSPTERPLPASTATPSRTPDRPASTPALEATETPEPSPTPLPDLSFHFDEDLSVFEETLIVTAIEVSRDLLTEAAGVAPPVSVFAYHSAGELESEFRDLARAQSWRADGMAVRLQGRIAEASYRGVAVNAGGPAWEGLRDATVMRAIAHEYVHVVQLENAGLAVAEATLSAPANSVPPAGPFWLLEGSAEVLSYLVVQELDLVDYAGTIAQMGLGLREEATALDDLESYIEFAAAGTPGVSRSVLAVDYLLRNRDIAQLFGFWQDIGDGSRWQDAFVRRFGTTLQTFYENFDAYYNATWGN